MTWRCKEPGHQQEYIVKDKAGPSGNELITKKKHNKLHSISKMTFTHPVLTLYFEMTSWNLIEGNYDQQPHCSYAIKNIPWLFASPGHEQPRYWLHNINNSLSSSRNPPPPPFRWWLGAWWHQPSPEPMLIYHRWVLSSFPWAMFCQNAQDISPQKWD